MAPPRTPASKHSAPADEPQPQDIESPLPTRAATQQEQLTKTLLALPTLAERLSYLMKYESTAYLHRGEYVYDLGRIAEHHEQMKTSVRIPGGRLTQKRIGAPMIATWVSERSGIPIRRQLLYNYRDGERTNLRTAFTNALAEFWHIDARLLDPTVPASRFEAPQDEPVDLDKVEHRTLELMNEIGFVGVKAREVKQSLGGTSVTGKHAFLGILEEIARERKTRDPSDEDTTPRSP